MDLRFFNCIAYAHRWLYEISALGSFFCYSTGFWYICFYLAAQCVEEILQISRKKDFKTVSELDCFANWLIKDFGFQLKIENMSSPRNIILLRVILVEETELEWNVIPKNASRLHTNIHKMLCNLTRESAFMPWHVHFFTEVLFSWEKSSTEQIQSP